MNTANRTAEDWVYQTHTDAMVWWNSLTPAERTERRLRAGGKGAALIEALRAGEWRLSAPPPGPHPPA